MSSENKNQKPLTTTKDYARIFGENKVLLDVRAPVEYERGSFPNAVNIPLTDNEEREKIGICYKEKGTDEAIKLGHELVSGEIKAKRLKQWTKFVKDHPNGALFCFRGGLRSRTVQQWIYEATGIDYPLIEGGYKAMRNYLIEFLDSVSEWINPIRISGRTGVGKTKLILQIKNHIDLEGLAKHKGSSFGRLIEEQLTQINFENRLAIQLLQHKEKENAPLFLEDEGTNIGRVYIPKKTYQAFNEGKALVLEASVEERTENIFQEYIVEALEAYQAKFGKTKGFFLWRTSIEESLDRIKRRLGNLRYRTLKSEMGKAINEQSKTGKAELHKIWIQALLVEYYDAMYDYHIARNKGQIEFQGNMEAIKTYIEKNLQG